MRKKLVLLTIVVAAFLALLGCGARAVSVSPTATPIPPTPTPIPPTPTPTSTSTPTPTPTPAPTPIPQMGVPVAVKDWLFIVTGISKRTKLSGFQESWSTKEGYIFVIVNYRRRNLSKLDNTIDSRSVVLNDRNGLAYLPEGALFWGDYYNVGFSSMQTWVPGVREDSSYAQEEAYVFVVPSDAKEFKIRFLDAPPIDLSDPIPVSLRTTMPTLDLMPPERAAVTPPAEKPVTGWTSYRVKEPDGLTIWLMEGDGQNAREVVRGLAYGWAKVSPDGRRLLVLVGPPVGWPSLYLSNLEGSNRLTLVENAAFVTGSFSPDSQHILLRIQEPDQEGETLYIADADGYNLRKLLASADELGISFFPDGRLLLQLEDGDGKDSLYLADADGNNLREIVSGATSARGHIAPDGQRMLLWVRTGKTGSLYLTDTEGGNRKELVSDVIYAWGAFSPDGQHMLLGVRPESGGDVTLYLADADGANRKPILTGLEDVEFKFSPNGQHTLLFVERKAREGEMGSDFTVYLGNSQAGDLVELEDAVDAHFSPDDSKVAYSVREPDGMFRLYIANADGTNPIEIGEGDITGWFR